MAAAGSWKVVSLFWERAKIGMPAIRHSGIGWRLGEASDTALTRFPKLARAILEDSYPRGPVCNAAKADKTLDAALHGVLSHMSQTSQKYAKKPLF
jgi:hypothetical protein